MTQRNKEKDTVKAVETTFDIIEQLYHLEGAGVTEVADKLGLAKSTVHKHLSTLVDREYVVEKDGEYNVGLRFLNFGTFARGNLRISSMSNDIMSKVADETGSAVLLMVEEHGEAVYIRRDNADESVIYGRTGKRTQIHAVAGGKAILAHLPKKRVDEIIDQKGLPELTEHTITDRETLFEELGEIRETGVAFNDEETKKGLRAVAAPILYDDKVLGSLSLAGPAKRLRGERFWEEIPEIVMASSNEIELNLVYS